MLPTALVALAVVFPSILAFNFPYESLQLRSSDVGNNSDLFFANDSSAEEPSCKTFPDDETWPSSGRWNAFNASLGGALIKSVPPAAACYTGEYQDAAKCAEVRRGERNAVWAQVPHNKIGTQSDGIRRKEDPLIPFGQWTLDNPCPVPRSGTTPPLSECKLESFPAYVVNATRVRDVQLAVNFARNNHIRLTIKNTGHDWLGRNTGGGALQVWVHHFKAFEYLPSANIAKYEGQAARVGAALEQWEVYKHMGENDITLLAPGSPTVGAYGGFMQGGGFSYVTSKYGLMADQVLSLEVVVANGSFIHADPETNSDLFWAIRGGGPDLADLHAGNFGIVTSAIVKAYPPTTIARSDFSIQTGPVFGNSTTTVRVNDTETFWKAVAIYFSHNYRINEAQGIMWNTISTQPPSTTQPQRAFSLRSEITKPGVSIEEMQSLVSPLINDLKAAGIPLTNPSPRFWPTYAAFGTLPGGPNGGTNNGGRFGSRLFPGTNFKDPSSPAFNATIASIRQFVEEGGYSFHSVDFAPSLETAGYPGSDSAVNPHLRTAMMHATGFDSSQYTRDLSAEKWESSHARLDSYLQKWRDASPGSGAYMNEADTEEPDFQESFYGENYGRLLGIKKEWDPWGLFYAVTGVGSEEWVVEGTGGKPTQQGRLCRVSG